MMRAMLGFVLLCVALASAPQALAKNPCTILVAGQDVGTGSVVVDAPESGVLPYSIAANRSTLHWTVEVHYAGFAIPALDESFPRDGARTRLGNASLASVTRYGSGLYEVSGRADLDDGDSCSVAFQVRIPGSPLRSVLGLAAVGLMGVGGAGLVAMAVKSVLDANDHIQAARDFMAGARGARQEAQAAMAELAGASGKSPPDSGAGGASGPAPEATDAKR